MDKNLTKEQYIKLFSNPVSGIACEFGLCSPDEIDYVKHIQDTIDSMKNIRYSKSMILRALEFWYDYNFKFYSKIKKIYHPAVNLIQKLELGLDMLIISYKMIKGYSDRYLFSHRYIKSLHISKYNEGLKHQHKLLQDKLGIKMIEFQEGSLQPYWLSYDYEKFGIEFTVFPNEHPYIPRQKISKVGMTDKGNIYILHRKNVGA